jgi:hypothetical protein
MTATDHLGASWGAGSRLSASRNSVAVAVGEGCSAPPISRASTRRTFVSTTAWRCPKANAATAAAVYVPMPGSERSAAWSAGTSPPWRSTIAIAASRSRSARRG